MNTDESIQVLKESPIEVVDSINPIEAIERANIDIQIATAKKYPRSLARVKKVFATTLRRMSAFQSRCAGQSRARMARPIQTI